MIHLPEDFINRMRPILGDEWGAFVHALEDKSPTSIRLNPQKISPANLPYEKVLWCDEGYYLADRPQFTFDPLLHAGLFYVQEASSMFVDFAIKQLINKDNVRCLDLCAAPGGKSTIVANHISAGSLLVSNEIIRSRANVLSENLMKWGNPNIIVSNNKPSDFSIIEDYFDLLLIDAPCSGEGMFRKDPQSIDEWSVENVKQCALRQREIIDAVWGTLKAEGYLFYSTCTYNREENEEMVAWLCDKYEAEIVSLPIDDSWGITKSLVNNKETYHFFPHKTKGEGFFFAAIQKKGETKAEIKKKKDRRVKGGKSIAFENQLALLLSNEFSQIEKDNSIFAFPSQLLDDLSFLEQYLFLIHKGVTLGEFKGKDFIPHQSLALNCELDKSQFKIHNVDWLTAISFLRKESLILQEAPRGILLLTYCDIPLGFVKNLGNRANNLYPNDWRIRSSNIPKDIVNVLEM